MNEFRQLLKHVLMLLNALLAFSLLIVAGIMAYRREFSEATFFLALVILYATIRKEVS